MYWKLNNNYSVIRNRVNIYIIIIFAIVIESITYNIDYNVVADYEKRSRSRLNECLTTKKIIIGNLLKIWNSRTRPPVMYEINAVLSKLFFILINFNVHIIQFWSGSRSVDKFFYSSSFYKINSGRI